jgi:hypothetical protein
MLEQPLRQHHNRRRYGLIAGIGLLLCIGMLLCAGGIVTMGPALRWASSATQYQSSPCFNGDLATLADYARFQFPPSAINVGSECDLYRGAQVHVWFDMDPADLDSFLASTWIELPLYEVAVTPEFGPASVTTTYWRGTSGMHNPGSHEVWIDMTNSQTYHVYFLFGCAAHC